MDDDDYEDTMGWLSLSTGDHDIRSILIHGHGSQDWLATL